jgi:endoglucanase
MKSTRGIQKFLISMICLALLPGFFPSIAAAEGASAAIPADLTADELVSRMRTGWNLGNTFDAWDRPGARLTGDIENIETLWLGGRANQTTQTLIQKVSALGFDVLRIPVTWSKVADPDNNWQIRSDWMERVQQVVDWALEEDMFVILNMHHENAALSLGTEDADLVTHPGNQFVTNVWRQIAVNFKDYGERLIFASMNEPRHEGGSNEWWGATQSVRDNVNYLNQAFVDTVRATGGNNIHRILQVPTVAAGATPNGMRDFIVPDDPMNPGVNKLIWSIHTYSPFEWAHNGRGTYGGADEISGVLDDVQRNAQRLGLPLLLGEWGSIHVSIGGDQELRDVQRSQHAEDYVREAAERGMVSVWWDNGGFSGTEHTFGLISRGYPHDVSEPHRQLIDGIMRGVGHNPDDTHEPEVSPDIPEPEPSDAAETPETGGTPENTDDTDGNFPRVLFWALILGAFAAITILVLFKVRKK